MSGQQGHGGPAGTGFGEVDAKLNVYALANGMDLVKLDRARELEWYKDGRDRGILVQLSDGGRLTVSATAIIDRRKEGTGLMEVVERDLNPSELTESFSEVLDRATELANAL